jgi:hypothetical protein
VLRQGSAITQVMTQSIMSFDGIWNWDSQSILVVVPTGDGVGDLDVMANAKIFKRVKRRPD